MTEDEAGRIGDWIRRAREQRRWNQVDLATRAGVSHDTVGKIESGRQGPRGPQRRTLKDLEEAFGVAPGTLDRVAAGEDVPLAPAGPTEDADTVKLIGALQDQINRLASEVRALADRVDGERP